MSVCKGDDNSADFVVIRIQQGNSAAPLARRVDKKYPLIRKVVLEKQITDRLFRCFHRGNFKEKGSFSVIGRDCLLPVAEGFLYQFPFRSVCPQINILFICRIGRVLHSHTDTQFVPSFQFSFEIIAVDGNQFVMTV